MNAISTIQESVKEELEQLNRELVVRLKSENPLLDSVISHFLSKKGKQLRPTLVLLCAKLFGQISAQTINAALSVELLHNASLIHDDVVDSTFVRHGKNSINGEFENKVAVLTGDYFLATSLRCGVMTGSLEMMELIAELGRQLSVGEIAQLNIANQKTWSEKGYIEVIRQKTAMLFRVCAALGAISSGSNPNQLATISEFGELLGICFQIKDDLFDYNNSNNNLGKPTENDLREGKISLPLIYALNSQNAQVEEMKTLIKKQNLSDQEIHQLYVFAKLAGGIEYAREQMDKYSEQAHRLLNNLPKNSITKELEKMLSYAIEREM